MERKRKMENNGVTCQHVVIFLHSTASQNEDSSMWSTAIKQKFRRLTQCQSHSINR